MVGGVYAGGHAGGGSGGFFALQPGFIGFDHPGAAAQCTGTTDARSGLTWVSGMMELGLRLSGGDPLRYQAVMAEVTWSEAMAAIRYQRARMIEDRKWELAKMEWLARILGSDFRAPELDDEPSSPSDCPVADVCDGRATGRCAECMAER